MSKKVLLKIIILGSLCTCTYQIKCNVMYGYIGDSGVGKTSILHKYVNNRFIEEHKATIGADFSTKEIMIDDNRLITLQIWDTAGQERFQSLGNAFYRGADACLLVYDITSKTSFEHIQKWKNNFIQQANPSDPSSFPFLLLGNKCDLEENDLRQVESNDAETYAAKQSNMKFYETSALTGQNLELSIRLIANIAAQSGADFNIIANKNVDLEDAIEDETNGSVEDGSCACQII